MRRADVVVYEPFAGPLYTGNGAAGGAELQSFYLARALASGGLHVRHVVAEIGAMRTAEGVEVVPLSRAYGGRGITRRRAILSALARADGHV